MADDIKTYGVKAVVEGLSGFIKSMESMRKAAVETTTSLKGLGESLKSVSGPTSSIGRSTKRIADSMTVMRQEAVNATSAITAIGAVSQAAGPSMAGLATSIKTAANGMKTLVRAASRTQKDTSKLSSSSSLVSNAMRIMERSVNAAKVALSSFGRAASIAISGIKSIGSGVIGAVAGIARFAKSIASGLLGSVGKFSDALRGVGRQLSVFGAQVTSLGFRLSLVFTAPFIAAQTAIIKSFATFETSMTKIETLVGVNAQQVKAWGEQILNSASALGVLPSALAEGLFFVTSAGIRDAAEAWDVLTLAAKSSAIGMGEVADVAKVVSAAIQVYRQEGLSAADATDVLVSVVREGSLEADKLATTLGRVIAYAENAGLTFAELGAFIATFTRTGVPVEVATTSLRSALAALQLPTDAAREALGQYGLSIEAVNKAIADPGIGFARTLIALSAIMGEDNEALGRVIGSQRGLAGVLAVTGGLADDYIEILENIENSHGVLATGFERVKQTLTFQWEAIKAAAQAAAVRIGEVIVPVVKQILESLLPVIGAITRFAQTQPLLVKLAVGFGLIAAALGPITIGLGLFVQSVGVLANALGWLTGILGVILSPLGLLAGPIIVLIGLLGALGLAFAYNARRILSSVFGIKDAVEKGIGGAGEAVGRGAREMVVAGDSWFSQLAQRAISWGKNIGIQLGNGIIQAAIYVVQALTFIGNIIAQWLRPGSPPKLLPDLTDWGTAAMNEYVRGWSLVDFTIFSKISDKLAQFIASITDDAKEAGKIMNRVRQALVRVVSEIRNVGEASASAMSALNSALGFSSGLIRNYINTMVALEQANKDVADAQEELNQIQSRYAAILRPIDQRLAEINDQVEDFRDNQRVMELQFIIQNPFASPTAKKFAQLELEQIDLSSQKRDIELQQQAETNLAQDRLDAASARQKELQDELDLQEALLDFQIENNNTLKQSKDDINKLTGAVGDLAGAIAKLKAAGPPEFDLANAYDKLLKGSKKEKPGKGGGLLDSLLGPFKSQLNELDKQLNIFGKTWQKVILAITGGDAATKIGDIWTDIKTKFEEFKETVQPITDAVNNLWEAITGLAETIGDKVSEAWTDFTDSIDIEKSDVINAIADAINALADGITTLDEAIQVGLPTFLGLDEIKATGLEALGGVFDRISAPFRSVIDMVTEFGTAADSLDASKYDQFTAIGQSIDEFGLRATVFGSYINSFRTQWESLKTTIGPIVDKIKEQWADFSESMAPVISELSDAFGHLMETLDPVIEGIKRVAEIVGGVVLGAIVGGVNLLIQGVIGGIRFLLNAILRGVQFITPFIQGFIKGVVFLIQGLVEFVDGLISFFIGLFTGDFAKMWEGVKLTVKGAIDFLIGLFVGIGAAILGAVAGIIGIVAGFVEGIIEWFKNLWNELVGNSIIPDMIKDIWDQFKRLPGEVWDTVTTWIGDAITAIGTFATDFIAKIKTGFDDTITNIATFITDFLTKVSGWYNDVLGPNGKVATFIKDFIGFFTDDLGPGLLQAFEDVIALLFGPETGAWAKNVIDKTLDFALDLLNGLAKGIIDNAWIVVDAIIGLATGAWEGIKNFFIEKSPSRLMMGLGKNIVAGLSIGIEDNTDQAVKSMKDLGKAAKKAIDVSLGEEEIAVSMMQQRSGPSVAAMQKPQSMINMNSTVQMGGVNINNGMDEARFTWLVERAVAKALGY